MSIVSNWDLTPIYPDIESEEFRSDLEAIVEQSVQLEAYVAEVKSDLKEAVDRYEAIIDRYVNLYAYASAVLTLNTSNEVAIRALSQVEENGLAVERMAVGFLNYLATRVEEIEVRTTEGGDLELYRYPLSQLLEQQRHQMSVELEDLAADLARSGGDAFGRLQQALGSAISAEWGEEGPKTVVELRNMASDKDREVRRRAYEIEVKLFESYEIAFAAALNGVTGTTLSLGKRRNWESPLDASLASSRIDREILNSLIGS
ncbi:MAG: M3 family oligoendopeptidase, partial [Spirochaetales bacterium]|nr:M3 family oligoendopeptidase [Spirochaetales bacterium]